MHTVHRFAVWGVALIGAGAAIAQETPGAAAQIYQQRTSDGRIVLSDRPLAGARTQRSWQFAREDAAAAQHDAAQRVVRLELEEYVAQPAPHRLGERVQFFRAVQHDGRDCTFALDQDGIGHLSDPLRFARPTTHETLL